MKRSILFRPSLIRAYKQPWVYKSIVIDSKRRGIRNSIRNLCDAFLARGRREKTIVEYIDGGAQKNKRCASTPPRRVDPTLRKGRGSCGRDEGCPRSNQSDPRDPSLKRTASRWCCLLDCYELSRERGPLHV